MKIRYVATVVAVGAVLVGCGPTQTGASAGASAGALPPVSSPATQAGFISTLRQIDPFDGFTDAQLVSSGENACTHVGQPGLQRSDVVANYNATYGAVKAILLVMSAEQKLCPDKHYVLATASVPPVVAAPPAAPAPPAATTGQSNAVGKAQDYLDYSAFSKSGLVKQLTYEGFSAADAKYAVEHITVDWTVQADKKAKDYMAYSSFSRQSLIKQLTYEGFTTAEATHGATSVGL